MTGTITTLCVFHHQIGAQPGGKAAEPLEGRIGAIGRMVGEAIHAYADRTLAFRNAHQRRRDLQGAAGHPREAVQGGVAHGGLRAARGAHSFRVPKRGR